jgi:short-subunit dehydrogenase
MIERKIFVTGGSNGLGRELVTQSKNRNINVNYHQRTNEQFLDGNFVFGDIKNHNTQKKIIDSVIENDSNVFINNAGVYLNKPISETTIDEINEIISVNLLSTIILTKEVLEIFKEKGHGMIYNINSLAGLNGSKFESVYCASKHGLKGFTDSIKQEIRGNKNIRIVNVTLGAFKSKMTESRDTYPYLSDVDDVANCILDHIQQDYNSIISDLIITRNS